MTLEQIAKALPVESKFEAMTADLQRCVFGAKPFGRLTFRNTGRGFETRRKVDFGRDYDYQTVTYQEALNAIEENRQVRICR